MKRSKTILKILTAVMTAICMFPGRAAAEETDAMNLTCPSAILMEASTGKVIYEKDCDRQRSPASITKIMTALLIFDALESGQIALTDEVTTSAYAKSMGGSQVYLEVGETQTVDTLIKCIMVASGNDASVAMAEYISGSEEQFVDRMNERAAGLGMSNTHFLDCCGLSDSDEHYTSARDVAIMARELITKYPRIKEYSTIWMENITHVTAQGTSEFGLANTNKLLKQYQYATGLKTGSTDKAKYCLCATAMKDGVELVAVVMACPDYKARFPEAQTLLNYGYSTCRLYRDEEEIELPEAKVAGGVHEQVAAGIHEPFTYLSTSGETFQNIEKTLIMDELKAPVAEGDVIGRLEYSMDGKQLGSISVYAMEEIKKAGYTDYLGRILKQWMLIPDAND